MAITSPQKSTSYHHGDLHDSLIQAGLEVLAADGIHALTLRKVAKQAGVSHTAPYRHFADKRHLFAAIAEEGFTLLTDHTNQMINNYEGERGKPYFISLGLGYIDFAFEKTEHFRLMFSNTIGNIHDFESLALKASESIETFGKGIYLAFPADKAHGDPIHLTVAYWTALHGIASLMIDHRLTSPVLEGEDCDTREAMIHNRAYAEVLIDYFYEGLKAKGWNNAP